MSDLNLGMPRRVVSLAVTMGAHGDCLMSTHDQCCSTCRDLVNTAFELNYNPDGMKPLRDVLDELLEDMMGDRDA